MEGRKVMMDIPPTASQPLTTSLPVYHLPQYRSTVVGSRCVRTYVSILRATLQPLDPLDRRRRGGGRRGNKRQRLLGSREGRGGESGQAAREARKNNCRPRSVPLRSWWGGQPGRLRRGFFLR